MTTPTPTPQPAPATQQAGEVSDAMVLAALRVQYPAAYGQYLRHPANGPKTSLRTASEIDTARRMIAAALSAAPRPSPTAQAASSTVLKAIREANMQLVRTGDNAFMLVPYKVATAHAAESVPAVGRDGAGMGHTDGGRNMFYEGRFDGESQREQQARLRWANDMRAAFERHTGNGWFDKDWRTETGLWSSAWHACLAAQPTTTAQAAQAAQAAESVLEDAARWNEVLMHVGAADHLGGQHFTLNTLRIRDQLFLLRGSVAQHFTACIDDSRAARKQGATP